MQDVKAITIAAGNFAAIIIPALIILLFTDFFAEATFQKEAIWTSIGYILILSAFGTALAKVLFNKLVHMATPVFASSVTYLMTVVAVLWGLADGEGFELIQALATLLILVGVYLANKRH